MPGGGYVAGKAELIGLTCMDNDAAGRFLGTRVSPKWASMLDPEVAAFLHRDFEFLDEQALAADFGERAVENLVALRRHAENDNFRPRI